MSGLMGSLSAAARALEAQQFGLDVTGQNIANVNTVGFARREALFAALPGTEPRSAGRGVEITGLRASRDERLERRLRQEYPAEQREAALEAALAVVETAVGAPGASLDAKLSAFFDSFGRLAADPTSGTARQEAVLQSEALANGFHDMARRLTLARRDADAGVRSSVDQINELVGRIATLNASVATVPVNGSQSHHLRDELGVALNSLSGLLDISTINRADGGVEVSFGNGRPLVIGANGYPLEVQSAPPLGMAAITAQGTPVTAEITSGALGGQLHARDTLIPGYLDQLDTLAFSVATEFNAVHQTGFDLAGNAGGAFFSVGALAGAASSIGVDAAVVADPSLIAVSGTGAAGDNTIGRQLAGMREERLMLGGTATFGDAWAQLVYRTGADSRAATDARASRGEVVRQVELLREQVSGVSLDEEAMMMMKFQRAYEANARFFQAVDRTLDTLIQALGR